jgi:hypothetical protein
MTPQQQATVIAAAQARIDAIAPVPNYEDPQLAQAAIRGFEKGYGAGVEQARADAIALQLATDAFVTAAAGLGEAVGQAAIRLSGAVGRAVRTVPLPVPGVGAGGLGVIKFPAPIAMTAEQQEALNQLATFREGLGLAKGKGTIARLEIGERNFYGINAHGQDVNLRVNPISETHAEADVFQQAKNANVTGGRGRLIVDRDLCGACGRSGAVTSLARQLGLTEIEIITPSGARTIKLGQ